MNIIRTKLCTAIYCLFGAATLCAVSTAVQATDQDLPAKTVRYNDLNLSSQAGARVLYGRIRAAARDVCELSTGGDPILRQGARACIEKAIDTAVKDVNSPVLTALRFGSSGDTRLASK